MDESPALTFVALKSSAPVSYIIGNTFFFRQTGLVDALPLKG